ncbi:MAG: tetratricopeptide repeat protein [Myxococcota bacterium]
MKTKLGFLALVFCAPLQAGAAEPDPYAAFEKKDYATALNGFQELLARDPSNLDVLERLGTTHYRLGNFEAARRAYSSLLERGSDGPKTLYNLGNAEVRSGQLEGSRARSS